MAVPSNTVVTFGTNGIREDLTDTITQISPMETPFYSAADKRRAKAQLHEWQTYSLNAASANAHAEGDDSAGQARSSTTRLNNRCQISKKVVITSGSQEAAPTAGRSNEHNFQMAKSSQELKRDVEKVLVGSQPSSAGSTGTAATLGALENWLSTNKTHAAGGTTPGWSSNNVGAVTDGATLDTTFTEAQLQTTLGQIWDEGGDPDVIMVGRFNKQQASSFSGIATQYRDNQNVGPAAIIGSADIYVSDWGQVAIVPNRFQRAQTVFALEMAKWGVAFYRPFKREALAKTGDSRKEHIVGEYTLVSDQEAASGKIADRATS